MKLSGIYMITNILNGNRYIGSSLNIKKRFTKHKNNLNKNKNLPNKHLQSAWLLYSEEKFKFKVIEFIINKNNDIKDFDNYLRRREDYYIQKLKPEYNCSDVGHTTTGADFYKTKEHREKLSVGLLNYYKKHPESITKISERMSQKYDNKEITHHNLGKTKETYKPLKIAIEKGSITRKQKFASGETHSWNEGLTKETNEKLKQISEKISKSQKYNYNNGKIIWNKNLHGKNNPQSCRNHPRAISIVQLTLDGKLVREYDYIKNVKDYDFNYNKIVQCVNHKYFTKLGDNIYGKNNEQKYIWLSKEEYNI